MALLSTRSGVFGISRIAHCLFSRKSPKSKRRGNCSKQRENSVQLLPSKALRDPDHRHADHQVFLVVCANDAGAFRHRISLGLEQLGVDVVNELLALIALNRNHQRKKNF